MQLHRHAALRAASLLLLAAFVTSEPAEEVAHAEEIEGVLPDQSASSPDIEEDPIVYATPKSPPNAYLAETFDDLASFQKTWRQSQAMKDGAEADIAKYDGVWATEERMAPLLKGDRSLVIKSAAKHSAIAAALNKPFKFSDKPLVVQYEVTLQEGQNCGGAYLKLLSLVEGKATKLTELTDKTPYTIMFGPDNCGNSYKVHFIFRHVNPLTGEIEEKHAKMNGVKVEDYFKDKKPHLYTLVIRPDNTFEISIDHISIQTGSLLEDVEPAVNPPKEIEDPEDFKPEDWDEREEIPDPDDTKPEDWDESAPIRIQDLNAVKPSGWLEDEPEMIPEPTASKPEDWDEDMDGDWEAPLIDNPACEGAVGCGPWSPPMIANPNHRGKWSPRKMPNPAYRGVWSPRMIPNPGFFEDLEPFKMTPISAVGFELWTITPNVLFDDVIITDNVDEARAFAADTFDLKMARLNRDQANMLQQLVAYSNAHPWLYAVYVLVAAVPVVIVVMCCCSPKSDVEADRKKTDAASPDVEEQEDTGKEVTEDKEVMEDKEVEEGKEVEEDNEVEANGGSQSEGESQGEEGDNSQEENSQAENSQEETQPEEVGVRTRARRRVRKD